MWTYHNLYFHDPIDDVRLKCRASVTLGKVFIYVPSIVSRISCNYGTDFHYHESVSNHQTRDDKRLKLRSLTQWLMLKVQH